MQGGLFVAPILQKLILNRNPIEVYTWVKKVSRWPFKRIIPCHFSNNIKASPTDFINAFDFLIEKKLSVSSKKINNNKTIENNIFQNLFSNIFGNNNNNNKKLPLAKEEDTELLSNISKLLVEQGVINNEAELLTKKEIEQIV